MNEHPRSREDYIESFRRAGAEHRSDGFTTVYYDVIYRKGVDPEIAQSVAMGMALDASLGH